MRVLIVGGTGTIGQAVTDVLTRRGHVVVLASRNSEEHPVDFADPSTITTMLESVGPIDAVACAAGSTPFAPWVELTRDDLCTGIGNKFLGQVELVQRGTAFVRPGGSFTLISGVLGRSPVPTGSVAAAANGAIEAWVRATASELAGSHRINCVSPTVLEESLVRYAALFAGRAAVPAIDVANAYLRSIEGNQTGQVFEL